MKFFIAAFLAVALADSPDCPESTEVFSYNERTPAAAGLAQKKDSPDCPESTEVFSYNERVPAAAGFVQIAKKDSPDCPESTEVFSYNERVPAAAGFVQLSACESIEVPGVTCSPQDNSFVQFLDGIGDNESLGESITLKGETPQYGKAATVGLVEKTA